MEVKISGWYGRLGNNLTQILKALLYGYRRGMRVVIPPHSSSVLRTVANRSYDVPDDRTTITDNDDARTKNIVRRFFNDADI